MKLSHAHALIVEDDRSWQQLLGEILTDAGLTVEVVDSLDAAVASLRTAPHRLAVVDLSLSSSDHHNEDGLRVLDAVRRYDPGCVTVLLTGFATVELAVNVLTEHGAFTCLRKEAFNRAQFRELVHRALASAPSLSSISSDQGPVSPADSQVIKDGADAQAPPGLALVVEDDAGWRSILYELLADAGYQVRLCISLGEALGRLRREKYILAVIDLSLVRATMTDTSLWGKTPLGQDLEGYRLLVSTRAAGIPTIVVSGVATPAEIERAYKEHGVFAYLEKQAFDRGVFLRLVAEARSARTWSAGSELDSLTDRERQVLDLLAQGMTNKEIAEALVITTNTVKRHLKAIFEKLEIHTRSAAAAKAISAGALESATNPTLAWPPGQTNEVKEP
jgi:DNA-binding NarL/FixJ family response regulator